jgi:hypothetical protein
MAAQAILPNGVATAEGEETAQTCANAWLQQLTSGLPVIHPEHVPEAICIPPPPDASASTLPARAPAQVAVRTLIVRLMSYCTRKPIS